jgi:Ca2+-binding RTX toxin-like protein
VSLGALADVLTVSNYAFLSAADTISGGTGADTANIDINGGASAAARVTISDTLNGLSGFETINIDDGAATYIGLTLTDTIVNANQANNALTIGLADSGGTATTALGLVDASGVTATVAIDMTGGGAVDTLKGGAGSDTLQGGLGLDVIDVSAGGADDVTLTGSVAANADKITGFTLAGTGATAATTASTVTATAATSLTVAGNGVVFAATDPDAVAGAIVNLVATDYVEAVGGGTAAGSDNHVVVITGTGYVTADAALDGNGGQNGESVVITFYNTSTQRAEIHNAHDADGDTTTLLAYFTDIGLSDMSSFSAANFAIESLG